MKKSLLAIGVLGLSSYAATRSSEQTTQEIGFGLGALACCMTAHNIGYVRARQKYEPWRVDATYNNTCITVTTYKSEFTLRKSEDALMYVRVDEGRPREFPLPETRWYERFHWYGLMRDPIEENAKRKR